MYWFAHDMGAAGPTSPLHHEAERRIAADPELTAAMVRVLNHELRPSEVLSRAVALGAIARAVKANRGRRRIVLGEARALLGNEVRRALAGRALLAT